MPTKASRLALALCGAAILGVAAGTAQDAPVALAGTAWRVVEITGTALPRDGSSPGREPHLVFDASGRVSGSDGCNRLTGPYTSKGNGLTFGALLGTMMACPKVGDLPQRVRRVLEGTSHYSIVDGRLQLLGATGKPLAVLEPRAPEGAQHSPLLGTSWQLVSLQTGPGRTSTPDDPTRYTVAFSAGGRLMARLDCNRGRGTWKVADGNRLELAPLALTRGTCPEGSLHDTIARLWPSIRSYAIDGGRLHLVSADAGVRLEFAPLAAGAP